jgi:DNA-binding NarL/FixJ family response regulator
MVFRATTPGGSWTDVPVFLRILHGTEGRFNKVVGNIWDLGAPLPDMENRSKSKSPLRVALADDRADILEEIRSLLEPEFQVVCSANEGAALIQAVDESKPDGVVADVQMPGLNGIDAGREIVRRGLCDAVVMLSMYDDPILIQTALVAGIRGYVLKEDAGEELIPALRTVMTGGRYLSRRARTTEFS